MPAEIIVVGNRSPTEPCPARWQFALALRAKAPQAYGMVRHYPWSAGCSPLALLREVHLATRQSDTVCDTLPDRFAYVGQWDNHGSQEELYVSLFILYALTHAFPGLSCRLLVRHAPSEDMPDVLPQMEASVEDPVLLALSSLIEESPWLDQFLLDCGTDDFTYSTDLIGRVWLCAGGRLCVVPVRAGEGTESTRAPFLSQGLSEERPSWIVPFDQWEQLESAREASMLPHSAAWPDALNAGLSRWMHCTALPAGQHSRHTCVVAVPPVVALTLHATAEPVWRSLILNHSYEYPLQATQVTQVDPSRPQHQTHPLVVPARSRASKWRGRLEAGPASERGAASSESATVWSVMTAFAIQAQNRRLVRVPLRELSRYALVLLLCAPTPLPISRELASLVVTLQKHTGPAVSIEALHVGFQLTWALARWQRAFADVAAGRMLRLCSPHASAVEHVLRRAATQAQERVAELGLPAEAPASVEDASTALATLERTLFYPDRPDEFVGSSDAWVAESIAAVHRECLDGQFSHGSTVAAENGGDAATEERVDTHFDKVAHALEAETSLLSDSSSSSSWTQRDAEAIDSDGSDSDDERYVADVLDEMERVKTAVQAAPQHSNKKRLDDADADAVLTNKPLMDVMELLSRTSAASQ